MVVPEDVVNALENGDVAAVRRWLTSGARDANDVDADGWTLLQCTLTRSNLHPTGDPPWASMGPSRVEMMRLLIEHGADASRKVSGIEPIFHCFYPEEVRVLLDAGADVNVQNNAPLPNMTPLMACGQAAPMCPAMVDVAKYLVKRGADLSLTNYLDMDAETYARRNSEHMHRLTLHSELLPTIPLSPLADWLADVRRAGGYQKFVKEPRVALVRLRLLCERGRASPPDGATKEARALERLFGPRTPLPRGVFWLVVQYWRSDRDV